MDLDGKHVVITGGSGGIGAVLARELSNAPRRIVEVSLAGTTFPPEWEN